MEGKIGLALATDNSNQQYIFKYRPLETNQWLQIIAVRDGNHLQVWNNGFLMIDRTDLPNGSVVFDGGSYDHSDYHIGLSVPQGSSGPEMVLWEPYATLHFGIEHWMKVKSLDCFIRSSILPFPMYKVIGRFQNLLVVMFLTMPNCPIMEDIVEDAHWIDNCPFSDEDVDGYPAWTDCNDNDSNAYTYDGSSASCAGISMQTNLFWFLGFCQWTVLVGPRQYRTF